MSRKTGFAVERTARVPAHKWTLTIISLLAFGGRRFGKLRAALPENSHKVLIEHLGPLERDAIVTRQAKVGGQTGPVGPATRPARPGPGVRPTV